MKQGIEIRGRPDFLLLLLTMTLVGLGLIMIFSASSPIAIAKYHSAWHYVSRQGAFASIGLLLMLLFMGIPYSWWKKAAPFLLITCLSLLVLVLVIGSVINGGKRWFVIGGFNFQPSEFAKLTIIVYLSSLISKKGEHFRQFKRGLLPILLVVGLILLLVMKQPDFGTVLILFFISGTIIMIGGADARHLAMLLLGLVPTIIYLAVNKSYRLERINSFMKPFDNPDGSGYQLIQSLYALGHGGLTGTGLGQSVQKLFYLPEAHTDFIFAVIGEELGFVGTVLFVIIFFFYLWRGFVASYNCSEPFGLLLGMGIVAMIFIQFVLNVGAVTGCLPITGIPLPFISYGGSSLILCLACSGILLSISRENNRRKQEQYQQSAE
ncbi:putative lipid II flippase FtsW [Cohnella endophytica]|uniref:Probable peptidoglycan glycosyltransferase FtsW n=1 Tax=Cohnella endophytica TaxID=2419778 RepID=A0A494Y0Z2_9BACL|nr:putative lipid II flippase FtsW [Cohnella endophytica]RKP55013.1 putative lipid II flippase FtsW [Cohnella endophytica]